MILSNLEFIYLFIKTINVFGVLATITPTQRSDSPPYGYSGRPFLVAIFFFFFFFFPWPPSPYSPVAQLYGEGNYERSRAFFNPARGLSHGITCHPHAMRYMAGEGVRGLLATRLPSFFPPTPAMPIILPASSSSSTWSFFLDSLAVSKIIMVSNINMHEATIG